MDELLTLTDTAAETRWMIGSLVDAYGDGYVHHFSVELHAPDLTANGFSGFEGFAEPPSEGGSSPCLTVSAFLFTLADRWRGWPGALSWTSLDREMTLEADHDGIGHVRLAVTLRADPLRTRRNGWSAQIVLQLDAGEDMLALAREVDAHLQPPGPAATAPRT